MADYALHRRHANNSRDGHWSMKNALRMRREHAGEVDGLLAHIRGEGAVKAADFERGDGAGGGGWWGWKNEKRWLESLFALGELMIARRENFQRVYDLRERVLANARDNGIAVPEESDVSEDAMRREFTLGAVRALGVAQARWINDYFRSGRKLKDADLDAFVDSGELVRIHVEEWKNPAYVHADHREALATAAAGRLRATQTVLLSPFDPVVWDRERATAMFGSNAIRRRRSASTATTCCRSCIAAAWSAGSMRRRTAPMACSRSRRSIWSPVSTRRTRWPRRSLRRSSAAPTGTRRHR
jgi:uncharacterized protein YcaQ